MSPRKPARGSMANGALSNMGDDYLAMLDASRQESSMARARREREAHQSSRPCPACREPMTDGACPEHGTAAEDDGAWLWAP